MAPTEFEYLREIAEKYGKKTYMKEDLDNFLDEVTEDQLNELRRAYEMIDAKEDAYKISRWTQRCDENRRDVGERVFWFADQVARLLILFNHLGHENIPPFSSYRVALIEPPPKKPNWENLSEELQYLQEPAENYGIYDTEGEILDFLETVGEEDMEILAAAAEKIRLNGHSETIGRWLDQFEIDQHQEAWMVYSLLLLMDLAGLSFG